MPKSVDYKKPRRFNIITVVLLAALAVSVYFAWIYVPLFLKKQDALRVLDETSSKFSGSRARYMNDKKQLEALTKEMRSDLTRIGVMDPDADVWIEIDDDTHVRFGVAYLEVIEWPFGITPSEKIYEVEFPLELLPR